MHTKRAYTAYLRDTQRHGYPSNVIENSGIPSYCIPEYQDKNVISLRTKPLIYIKFHIMYRIPISLLFLSLY